jgi:phage terminase large subunit-like protein
VEAAQETQTQPQNITHPDVVTEYAIDVVEGREIAGPLVRLACQRHLDDIKDGPSRGLTWDLQHAEWVFGYFRHVLRLAGGENEGKPFELERPQKFIVGSLFGWKKDGAYRFRTAYVEMGKGSGKSPMAAGIGLFKMSADGQARAQVVSAATDKEQAKILFGDAVAMVDQSPILSENIHKTPKDNPDPAKVWNLAHLASASSFKPIASESLGRGKSGFRPYCVLLDEIHEHRSNAMVEFMRKNIKGRPNALVLMITNSGVYDVNSVCWQYHDYSDRMLNGKADMDDSFFAYVCGLDKGDDWTDPTVWKKANPLLGVTIPSSYLEKEVMESIGMPSKQSLTRRLNFCEWVDVADPFVTPEVWRASGGEVDRASLHGRKCWGGLDLSGKNDLTAFVLVFEKDANGKKAVLPFFWAPKNGIRQRSQRDHAEYEQWAREGYISTPEGSTIDYSWVAKEIGDLTVEFDIQTVAFDRHRMDDLVRELDAQGVNMTVTEHGQGYADMSPAVEALEDDLLEARLSHGCNPVLTWNIHNAKVIQDPAGNRKFDKRKATGRIDGAVALAMAERLMVAAEDGPSYAVTVL